MKIVFVCSPSALDKLETVVKKLAFFKPSVGHKHSRHTIKLLMSCLSVNKASVMLKVTRHVSHNLNILTLYAQLSKMITFPSSPVAQ